MTSFFSIVHHQEKSMTSMAEERIVGKMRKIAKMRFNQSNDRNDMMMVSSSIFDKRSFLPYVKYCITSNNLEWKREKQSSLFQS